MDEAEIAEHGFLGGRLRLREPRSGHRSGTDAVLLAAASRLKPGEHLIDVGAGAGAAALAALCRVEGTTATLIERSESMAALARQNANANGFGDRVEILVLDVFDKVARRAFLYRKGDVVISNPPFYLAGTVRASTITQRAESHVLSDAGHGDWLRAVMACAAPRGRAVVVHRPDALAALVAAAERRGAINLQSIQPKRDQPATRILIEVLLGRRSPLTMQPVVVLHESNGTFTPQANDLHRGGAWL